MTEKEVRFWRRVANDLGIEVVTPFEIAFPSGSRLRASAPVKNFGPKNGMVVDADYHVIEPHKRALTEAGYGYSSNIGQSPDTYRRDVMSEVLADLSWSGRVDAKPAWLP